METIHGIRLETRELKHQKELDSEEGKDLAAAGKCPWMADPGKAATPKDTSGTPLPGNGTALLPIHVHEGTAPSTIHSYFPHDPTDVGLGGAGCP